MPVSFPRLLAGAISDIKRGATMVDTPTPNPPNKRVNIKVYTSLDKAEPAADKRYKIPMPINVFLRPYLDVGYAPSNAPITVPHSAALKAQPCMLPLRDHRFCICFSAPEMTTVSKPNRKPARAAVMDQIISCEFFIC